jgi:hypothetical protein
MKKKRISKRGIANEGRPSMGPRVTTILKGPPKLMQWLTREARKRELSRNALILEILEEYRADA